MRSFFTLPLFWIAFGAGAVAFLAFLVGVLLIVGIKKVGPHQALLVYGPKGTKVVSGGSTFVNPLTSQMRLFSLGVRSFLLQPPHPFYTKEGISLAIEAMTYLRVRSDDQHHILVAAEAFLGKHYEDQEAILCSLLAGHLRNCVGQMTIEDLINQSRLVGTSLMTACTPDLEKLGMEILSFSLRSVETENGAMEHLGRLRMIEMRKQAAIAEAVTARDVRMQQAHLARETAIACAQADRERVKAEIESMSVQALIASKKEEITCQRILAETHREAEILRIQGQAEADVHWVKQVAARGEHAVIGERADLPIMTRSEATEKMITTS
jgi:flotillin